MPSPTTVCLYIQFLTRSLKSATSVQNYVAAISLLLTGTIALFCSCASNPQSRIEANSAVYDGLDKCPNTPRGVKVDRDGCPLAAPIFEDDRDTLILEGIFFEFDKAVLTSDSAGTLDRVAASLKAWPEVRVEIVHTNRIGS